MSAIVAPETIFGAKEDWNNHHTEYKPCEFCFSNYQLPSGWIRPTPGAADPPQAVSLEDTDSEPDCDPEDATDSDRENDSDADDYGVQLEPSPKVTPQGQKRPAPGLDATGPTIAF